MKISQRSGKIASYVRSGNLRAEFTAHYSDAVSVPESESRGNDVADERTEVVHVEFPLDNRISPAAIALSCQQVCNAAARIARLPYIASNVRRVIYAFTVLVRVRYISQDEGPRYKKI